jgi:heme exporter protein D
MQFQFESLTDFFTMSGHGPYVWACYFVTIIAIIYLLISPITSRRKLIRDIKRQQRIESAQQDDVSSKQSW